MTFAKQRQSTFNSIFVGLGIGIVMPVLLYAVLEMLSNYLGTHIGDQDGPLFRKRTIALFSICMNLIPFTIFNRKRFNLSIRGVVLATLIWGAMWVYLYFGELYT